MILKITTASEDETQDSFYHGRVLILQKKKGYRFSVDAPLLADFIRTESADELLELGAGCGVISLLLSIKPFKRITAVEIQESLFALAERNVALNRLEKKIFVVHSNLMTFRPGRKYDIIFSNPPYHLFSSGHLSPSEEKSIARHELKCDIFGIMRKTAELLEDDGRAYFVYPTRRKEDFRSAMEKSGLKIKIHRSVIPRKGKNPSLFLAACVFAADEVEERPPLYLYDDSGSYTEEAREIFAGRVHASPA
jgi:tRNA1(Val) A37 N6-methylase TrmN6